MKKLIAPLAAGALLVSVAFAYAEDTSGMITSIDAQKLTLEDGTTFTIGEGVSMEGLEPGTSVNLSYEEKDGEKVVNSITPVTH